MCENCSFVCVEVLQPSQPTGVMSSAVSLPNHTFSPLKREAKFVADGILFFFLFSEKTSLDISCESSAKQTIHMECQDLFSWQTIHMKCQDLFSLKKKMSSAAALIGALMVNMHTHSPLRG